MGRKNKHKVKNNQRRRNHRELGSRAAAEGVKAGCAGRRALIGGDVSGSYSKALHGLISDGAYGYDLISIAPVETISNDNGPINPTTKPQDGALSLRGVLADTTYDGYNVTIPYKRTVIECLDSLSEGAAALSAVNTVLRKADGTLVGYNTDLYGFMEMVGRDRAAGRRAAVLGTGGAASAAAEGLRRLGAGKVALVSRTPGAARASAATTSSVIGYSELDAYAPELIVNATPVGMGELLDRSPLDAFPVSAKVAVDLIYNPLRTRFLQDADDAGMETVSGLSMLIYQALQARDIWNAAGEPSAKAAENRNEAAKAAAVLLKEQLNIVVIGMPGSGKSSIARRLAKLMQRSFMDTDRLTEQLLGEPIPDVIRDISRGEQYFRKVEREAVCHACAGHGTIIATGGGAVMDPVSQRAIRANGIVIYLDRPLEMLAYRDRPISQAKGVARIFEERKEIYEALADIVVVNNRRFGATRTADGRMRSYNQDLNEFAAGLRRQVDEYVSQLARRIAGTAEK